MNRMEVDNDGDLWPDITVPAPPPVFAIKCPNETCDLYVHLRVSSPNKFENLINFGVKCGGCGQESILRVAEFSEIIFWSSRCPVP